MAKVTNLAILNSSDKTRMYSVATGNGVPTDADDPINNDIKSFPIGSQYTDLTGKKFYVRTGKTLAAADWTAIATGS